MAADFEGIGTGLGAIGVVLMAMFGVIRGNRKSDGTPPLEREPPVNETKAMLSALRERIDHAHNLAEDDRRDMVRQLDRIERRVERICDQLDAEVRLGIAAARIAQAPPRD